MSKNKKSEIIETKSILEVKDKVQHLSGKVLFIFDFDNVIGWLGSEIIIGTDPWFEKHLKGGIAEHGDLTRAELATLDIFMHVHNNTPVQAVEAETISFIQELQNDKKCVIALTSRSGKYLEKLTREQANALGICFSNSDNYKSRTADLTHLGPHCHVADGYFYTGGKDKGLILKEGLTAIGISIADYDHVVFVDDDLHKIKQVQDMAAGITHFVGFRYGYLDAHLETVKQALGAMFNNRAKL